MDCALPAINPPPASQGGVFVYILTYAAGSQILPPGGERRRTGSGPNNWDQRATEKIEIAISIKEVER
jgi:hypothetical protein